MECLLCACQLEALQLNVLLQCVKVSVVCLRIPSQVYYQSFIYVICFLFYAVPNCKHATSNFPFSSSFKLYLFSLECPQTHLDVSRHCRLCAPLGSDWFWPGELASFRSHERGHSRPGKCHRIVPSSECGPQGDRMMDVLWFFDTVDEYFLKITLYFEIMWDFWKSCQENTESFQTFLTHFFPIVNVLHYHRTFVRNNTSTLLQYYWVKSRFYCISQVSTLMSFFCARIQSRVPPWN